MKISVSGRKMEIVKLTEQLLASISSGDFEAYTYVIMHVAEYHNLIS